MQPAKRKGKILTSLWCVECQSASCWTIIGSIEDKNTGKVSGIWDELVRSCRGGISINYDLSQSVLSLFIRPSLNLEIIKADHFSASFFLFTHPCAKYFAFYILWLETEPPLCSFTKMASWETYMEGIY